MGCLICRDLQLAYEAGRSEYIEARSSTFYQVCKKLAARKNVDMERARYELEEHRRRCIPVVPLTVLLPKQAVLRRPPGFRREFAQGLKPHII